MADFTATSICSHFPLLSRTMTSDSLQLIVQQLQFIEEFIFWDITSCNPLKVNRRFGGTSRLHLRGRRISQARNQRESRWQPGFLLGLFSDPEDGGDMFLRKAG
jgi:hypothetical protein